MKSRVMHRNNMDPKVGLKVELKEESLRLGCEVWSIAEMKQRLRH